MSGSLTIPAAGDTLDALSDAGTGRDGLDGAPTSLAVAELAARLCRQRIRVEQAALANWLLDGSGKGSPSRSSRALALDRGGRPPLLTGRTDRAEIGASDRRATLGSSLPERRPPGRPRPADPSEAKGSTKG